MDVRSLPRRLASVDILVEHFLSPCVKFFAINLTKLDVGSKVRCFGVPISSHDQSHMRAQPSGARLTDLTAETCVRTHPPELSSSASPASPNGLARKLGVAPQRYALSLSSSPGVLRMGLDQVGGCGARECRYL